MDRQEHWKRLGINSDQLAVFCEKWRIRELALLGSILGQDFAAASDIDMLVTFRPDAGLTLWRFIHFREELEQLTGRKVDVIERPVLKRSRNYIRRQAILESAEVIYAA